MVAGPTGRRRWPDEVKGRLVAESYAARGSVSAVARQYGMAPSQLFTWRRLARDGRLALPGDDEGGFAPLLIEKPAEPLPAPVTTAALEIEAGGVILRLAWDTPAARIAEIVAALRAVR